MKTTILLVSAIIMAANPMTSFSQNSDPNQQSSSQFPHKILDHKARAADVSNYSSMSDLTQTVVTYPHIYKIPSQLVETFQNSLRDSEIKYRLHQDPGVSETEIVDFTNRLAKRLGLPDYISATHSQVRHLRMNLALQSPSFMGPGLTHGPINKGDSINDHMSPLQAFHLTAVLIDQKLLNPSYQDPNVDLVQADQKLRHEAKQFALANKTKHALRSTPNYHRLELEQRIYNSATSMSSSEADAILSDALKTLSHK